MSTTRPGRFGDVPTSWIYNIARQRHDIEVEIVDLRDYPMPMFDQAIPLVYAPVENPIAKQWAARMATFDGYIFVTAEYNHSITGVLKNALDFLFPELQRKPAAFVGYGGVGGARAVEHLRHILAEQHVATLKPAVHIGMMEMIGMLREGKSMADYPHLDDAAKPMLDDLVWWTNTLRAGRRQQLAA
jgi:NAD(P)H-dependent FMN reductase